MTIFKFFTRTNRPDDDAGKLYLELKADKYKERPFETKDKGEGMSVINEVILGYWKPRYLLDDSNHRAYEFMSELAQSLTITEEDIDWDSLKDAPGKGIDTAKRLSMIYPSFIYNYRNGVAKVEWQLNPDGYFYMDEDGFGMSDDVEYKVYGFIDRKGNVVAKFRTINGSEKLKQLRAEAEKNNRERNKSHRS